MNEIKKCIPEGPINAEVFNDFNFTKPSNIGGDQGIGGNIRVNKSFTITKVLSIVLVNILNIKCYFLDNFQNFNIQKQ